MFSSKPKEPVSAAPMSGPAAPATNRRVSSRPGAAPSIISADLVVQGSLTSTGDIQIEGRVEGDVRSMGLVIGEKAEVDGELWAEELTVRGTVTGRIRARKVTLTATSRVQGDILHEAFAVKSGAFFEGNCRHSDNPLGDEARKPAVSVVKNEAPQPVTPFPTGLAAQGT